MSSKDQRKHLAAAIGTAFAASIAFAGTAAADADPFQVSELDGGYMQLAGHDRDKDAEGKCGEAKCGGDKSDEKKERHKDGEGSCGGDKADKDAEGSCGGDK
jgi:uncharacterized low-complexity protein